MKASANDKPTDSAGGQSIVSAESNPGVRAAPATPPKPEVSNRVIVVFVALQLLDIVTTLLGLRAGASEANFTVAWFMQLGPGVGLLVAKFMGYLILVVAFAIGRTRVLRLLNFWFAGIVTWNLVMIWIQRLGSAGG